MFFNVITENQRNPKKMKRRVAPIPTRMARPVPDGFNLLVRYAVKATVSMTYIMRYPYPPASTAFLVIALAAGAARFMPSYILLHRAKKYQFRSKMVLN